MTRVRLQTFEEDGATGEVWVRDTASTDGGAWGSVPAPPNEIISDEAIATFNTSSTSFVDVTGLSIALEANTFYEFRALLRVTANATTTGVDVAVNGPATSVLCYTQAYWTSATARTERGATAYDNNTASTASNGTAERIFEVYGVIYCSAAGNLVPRIKVESGSGGSANVLPGSFISARAT